MGKIGAMIFGIVGLALLMCVIMAYPFMWIWNYAVVEAIDGTNTIDIYVAFWLMMFLQLFVKTTVTQSSKK